MRITEFRINALVGADAIWQAFRDNVPGFPKEHQEKGLHEVMNDLIHTNTISSYEITGRPFNSRKVTVFHS